MSRRTIWGHDQTSVSVDEWGAQASVKKFYSAGGFLLEKVTLDSAPASGTIKVHWDKNENLAAPGTNNSIEFVPYEYGNVLVWDCTGGTMAPKYRPATCRAGNEVAKSGKSGKSDKSGKSGK